MDWNMQTFVSVAGIAVFGAAVLRVAVWLWRRPRADRRP